MQTMINQHMHVFDPKRGDFARFQFVNKQSEYVVFGYIRQIQRRIFNKEHIPTEISQICAIYYNPMEIKLGNQVDARDRWGTWYLAEINWHKKAKEPLPQKPMLSKRQLRDRSTFGKLDGVYVHYLTWDGKWDEWIFITANTMCTCLAVCIDTNHRLAMAKSQTGIKQFVYKSDYDKHGICYFLGTNFGQESWINPAKRGLIKLNSSGWSECFGRLDDFVGRTPCDSCTKNVKNGFVSIDFGNNIKIKPCRYTLRHDNDWDDYYLRDWTFSASNDGMTWILIRRHAENYNYSFDEKGKSHTFVVHCKEYYSHFKIEIMGANSAGSWRICTTGFEIYGSVFGLK